MCAFYLTDVSRGREPNRRLAFGGCLQTLALCSVFIFAVTLCRFAIYLKTALCRAAPLTSSFVHQRPFDIANESVSRGKNPTVRLAFGKRLRFLAFFRATHFLSLRAEIRGPHGILCTRGEKAHTSKRVSIAAPTMRFQQCSLRRELS